MGLFQIFCLILNDCMKQSFVIDVNGDKTIAHLRYLIWQRIPSNNKISETELVLLKVDIPTKGIDMKTRIHSEDINKYESSELYPFQIVGDCFSGEYFSTNIRIIVQPLAATGKFLSISCLPNKAHLI